MPNNFLVAGSVAAGLAVVLGAFGAHGLEKITADEKILHAFQTAVQYQMYHALALLALSALQDKLGGKWLRWAGFCFIGGILLFSGSLYLLTYLKIEESSAVNWAGPITPVGGIFFVAGWAFFIIGALRRRVS